MTTFKRVAAAAAVLAALVATSCSPLPAESHPRAIDRKRVADLFPAPTTTVLASGKVGRVCFVRQTPDQADSGSACKPTRLPAINAQTLIEALAAGPNKEDLQKGLASWVPQDTRLLDARRAEDDAQTLVIDLSSEINSLSSPNNVVAFRQIVQTLTEEDNKLGIDAIRLEVEGKPSKIFTDRGQLTTAELGDFATPAPESSSTGRVG